MKCFCKICLTVVCMLCILLASCLAQSHWSNAPYQSTYSSPLVERFASPDMTRNLLSDTKNGSCVSVFELEVYNGCTTQALVPSATVSTGKRLQHTGTSHSPMHAVASGSGNISISVITNGAVNNAGAASGSASASGEIAGLGTSSGQKSLAVNGSCSANATGSVGIVKDGVSVSNTSPPPGSFSGSDTHSASFNASNYLFHGNTITMTASASAITSGSAVSGSYWVFWYGMARTAGRASVDVSGLTLNAYCLPYK